MGHRRSPRFRWARAYPAISFIFLAIGVSWLIWIPGFATNSQAQWPILLGAFGPAIAAAVMVWLQGGTVRAWLRSILRFRLKVRWYLLALAIPLVDPVIQTILAWEADFSTSLGALGERLPLYASSFVLVLLLGGGQEEFGWRGWLLPQLQRRTHPLLASLLIGAVHAIWHLPLFIFEGAQFGDTVFVLYLPFIVAGSVVFTWLFNVGRESLPLAMMFHAQVNVASALVPVTDFAEFEVAWGTGLISTYAFQGILAATWIGFAVLLVLWDRRLGYRPASGLSDTESVIAGRS